MKQLALLLLSLPVNANAGLVTVFKSAFKPQIDPVIYLMAEVKKIEDRLANIETEFANLSSSSPTNKQITYTTVQVQEVKLSPAAEEKLLQRMNNKQPVHYYKQSIVPAEPIRSADLTQYSSLYGYMQP